LPSKRAALACGKTVDQAVHCTGWRRVEPFDTLMLDHSAPPIHTRITQPYRRVFPQSALRVSVVRQARVVAVALCALVAACLGNGFPENCDLPAPVETQAVGDRRATGPRDWSRSAGRLGRRGTCPGSTRVDRLADNPRLRIAVRFRRRRFAVARTRLHCLPRNSEYAVDCPGAASRWRAVLRSGRPPGAFPMTRRT
jgi:hypothetical protein